MKSIKNRSQVGNGIKITGSFLLASLFLLYAAHGFANETLNLNKQGVDFLRQGKPKEAQVVLMKVYKEGKFNQQTLFLLAHAAKALGDNKEAIRLYEEMLTKEPKATRVRLELATLLHNTGQIDKGREHFLTVKASNPPKKIGDNIERFLQAGKKPEEKNWRFTVSAGISHDSNVNAGPYEDTVLMYSLPFTLSDDAKETSDIGFTYGLRADYLKNFNQLWGVQGSVSLNATDYAKLQSQDTRTLSGSLGPSFKHGTWAGSLPFITSVTQVGYVNSYYSSNYGISPQINKQISRQLSASAMISLQQKHIADAGSRDSWSYTVSPSMRYILSQTDSLSFGGYFGKEDSQQATSSNRSFGLNGGYSHAFPENWSVSVNPSISHTRYYEAIEAANTELRRDVNYSASLGVNKALQQLGVNMSLRGSHSINSSNIDMNKHKRTKFSLNFSKQF
jgi:outer membrane protein